MSSEILPASQRFFSLHKSITDKQLIEENFAVTLYEIYQCMIIANKNNSQYREIMDTISVTVQGTKFQRIKRILQAPNLSNSSQKMNHELNILYCSLIAQKLEIIRMHDKVNNSEKILDLLTTDLGIFVGILLLPLTMITIACAYIVNEINTLMTIQKIQPIESKYKLFQKINPDILLSCIEDIEIQVNEYKKSILPADKESNEVNRICHTSF